jgi:hypothetical protein
MPVITGIEISDRDSEDRVITMTGESGSASEAA